MRKIRQLYLSSFLFITFNLMPFGNKLFAYISECNEQFNENVEACTEIFPRENPITGFFQVVCIIGAAVAWVICQIGELL